MSAASPRPHELVERALEASTADECVVIVDETTSANLRWANNTLTTNGVSDRASVTVVSMVAGGRGVAAAGVTRDAVEWDDVAALVADADSAARAARPADDASPLVPGDAGSDWTEPPVPTSIEVFARTAPALGEALSNARAAGRQLYGFMQHDLATVYLGSSSGLRRRHVQPTGHVGVTGKNADLTDSAWVGQATRDFSDVDPLALDAELARRLAWGARRVELPAGRYDTVLPPTAVADLMIYAYWTAGARDAHDGHTVFSRPGGGTRVGDRLSPHQVQLFSDPDHPGLQCAPFVVAPVSGSDTSVFDNGLPHGRTDWVRDGQLAALMTSRHSARVTGLPVTPGVDNLVMTVGGAVDGLEQLVAGIDRGLLLTCLWYIREVDPQNLLLTGLTRDGVYLVEGGEVVGAVNNFRFNESPVDLIGRLSAASVTVPAFSREWGDYFSRTAMPALRIPDFNMSSVSAAS